MISGPPKFYKNDPDFKKFHYQIKLIACPHCQITGCLILHGYLYGYDEKNSHQQIIRGHRIFCSNRNQRPGCGGTFSILASHILKNFTITTQSFWDFLVNILKGLNKFAAFSLLKLPFSTSSIYRLYQRIKLCQPHLRTLLLNKIPSPVDVPSPNPLIKTILHIKSAFKYNPDPLSAFQSHFQAYLI